MFWIVIAAVITVLVVAAVVVIYSLGLTVQGVGSKSFRERGF